MRVPISVVLLLVIVACGSDPLGPRFAQGLTRFAGCGDVIFFAVDADDEVMVRFRADGLVAAARAAGVETTTVVALPSDEVELVVESGSRVSDATCDDVIENAGPRVVRSWTAASGTATVRIRPVDEWSARGDLVLEDVTFTSDDAEDASVERLEWLDVSVGWLPG